MCMGETWPSVTLAGDQKGGRSPTLEVFISCCVESEWRNMGSLSSKHIIYVRVALYV